MPPTSRWLPTGYAKCSPRRLRKLDLGGKSAVYARAGVGYIWFVDPIARSLEAKVLRGGKWVEIATLHDDATVSLPPFEAIKFQSRRFVAAANYS